MASPNNTVVSSAGPTITDSLGNLWSITANGLVSVNGVPDLTTGRVTALVYEGGKIWQENADNLWWSKLQPSDSWGPVSGTAVSPVPNPTPDTQSPDNAVVRGKNGVIIDAHGNRWSITVDSLVAVNGVPDLTTGRVIALAYEGGKIWQENADNLWWAKTQPSDQWSPANGTSNSPIPAASPEVMTMLSGQVVSFDNNAPTPIRHNYDTVDDNGVAVVMNFTGSNILNGNIHNAEGFLVVNVSGGLASTGTIVTQGGIGSATTSIFLRDGSAFRNAGVIATHDGAGGHVAGNFKITGSGNASFENDGLLSIDGHGSLDIFTSGPILNAGNLVINAELGTSHSVITTGNITNTGVIENHNKTELFSGAFGDNSNVLTNSGVIENLLDAAQLQIIMPSQDGLYYGTLVNSGQILAQGGGDHIEIAASVSQTLSGHIDIKDNGAVKLDSSIAGGTIRITSGMLEFGGPNRTFLDGASQGFQSQAVLDGATAHFRFAWDHLTTVFQQGGLSTVSDLFVYVPDAHDPNSKVQIADLHLSGQYHASQFTTSGNDVIYTKSA